MQKVPNVSPIPIQLVSGCCSTTRVLTASTAMYGASRKKLTATSCWARRSAWTDSVLEPVKRHTTITLAIPSIALSRPKPTSAIDPATSPATTPTVPSIVSQASDVHASSRARRARRSHSRSPATIGGSRTRAASTS